MKSLDRLYEYANKLEAPWRSAFDRERGEYLRSLAEDIEKEAVSAPLQQVVDLREECRDWERSCHAAEHDHGQVLDRIEELERRLERCNGHHCSDSE